MEIITDRHYVESFEYCLDFFIGGTDLCAGFECDPQGNIDMVALEARPEAYANYQRCVADSNITSRVRRYNRSYWAPAIGKCHCGTKVELESSWANSCPKCGTEYNSSGQQLAPRSQWGEETGELGEWGYPEPDI